MVYILQNVSLFLAPMKTGLLLLPGPAGLLTPVYGIEVVFSQKWD